MIKRDIKGGAIFVILSMFPLGLASRILEFDNYKMWVSFLCFIVWDRLNAFGWLKIVGEENVKPDKP